MPEIIQRHTGALLKFLVLVSWFLALIFKDMKAFITGGSGFVGKRLIALLIENGYEVNALARSKTSAEVVENLGATAIMGDILDTDAIATGMDGCTSVFHLAAEVNFFKSEKELYRLNVSATQAMVEIAQKMQVKNFIYLSAASVVMNGKPICNVDESFISDDIKDGYSRTKSKAEQMVLSANTAGFRTIALRPSLIWGKGENHLLPVLIEAVQKQQLSFIDGGNHKFIICHVDNVCHALLLADRSDIGGEAFFITDGKQFEIKEFISRYLGTQGVETPDKSISFKKAWIVACIMEFVWKTFRLKGMPPLTKATVYATGIEFTASDAKARKQLGYTNVKSVDEGFSEMMVS